jgi:hypothetical protein
MPLREDEVQEVQAIVRAEIAKAIAAIPKAPAVKKPVSVKRERKY